MPNNVAPTFLSQQITDRHKDLVSRLNCVIYPWRKLTIAIDGLDGSGKSSLGRFLAWQLGMPLIETDLLLNQQSERINHDIATFSRLLAARHDRDRPAIVEGVFVVKTLAEAGVTADFLIYVEATGREGSHAWKADFEAYEAEYKSRQNATFVFTWSPGISS